MYKRDFAILIVSAFAIYFTIQHEGAFTFRKAWYCLITLKQKSSMIRSVTIEQKLCMDQLPLRMSERVFEWYSRGL